jgi:hypothetical protein
MKEQENFRKLQLSEEKKLPEEMIEEKNQGFEMNPLEDDRKKLSEEEKQKEKKKRGKSLYLNGIKRTDSNKLGTGNFGTVFLGTTNDGDSVALKSLKIENLESFEKEIKLLQ